MTSSQACNLHSLIDVLENLSGRWGGMFSRGGNVVGEFPEGFVLITLNLTNLAIVDEVESAIKVWLVSVFPLSRLLAISFLRRNEAVSIYFSFERFVTMGTVRAVRQHILDSDVPKTVFYPIKEAMPI
jgi:hypothetical protein